MNFSFKKRWYVIYLSYKEKEDVWLSLQFRTKRRAKAEGARLALASKARGNYLWGPFDGDPFPDEYKMRSGWEYSY